MVVGKSAKLSEIRAPRLLVFDAACRRRRHGRPRRVHDARSLHRHAGLNTSPGYSCADYVTSRLCASGGFVSGAEWAGGEAFNFPEFNCCACGKGQNKGSVARNTAASKLLNARGPWRPPKREPPAATAPRGRSRSRGRGAARAKTSTSPTRTEADVREAAAATVEALPRKGDYPPGVERTPLVDTLLELERGGVKAAAATAPARVRRDGDVRSARRDAKARAPAAGCRTARPQAESPKLPWNEEAFCPRWPPTAPSARCRRRRRRCATRRAAPCT